MCTISNLLDKLNALPVGEGKSSTGFPLEVKAVICFQRWHRNVAVKTIAEAIGRTHSRVTEISAGRDFNAMKPETKTAFKALVQAQYAAVGLVYTGDYVKSHGSRKLPAKTA